jgi:hypothetical protein
MRFKELLESWAHEARTPRTARTYEVRLPLDDAAKLHALTGLFPGRTEEEFITDLLKAAIQELEAAMPYRPGTRVISQDEQGDPVYEDVGPTPRFLALTKQARQALSGQKQLDERVAE